jgi:hypothetical protein
MQSERRRDPYPWTWEIPVALSLATLFVVVLGVQLGRSAANLLAGAGWTWPAADGGANNAAFGSPLGTAFWTSLPGVLAGHSETGLPSPALTGPTGLAAPGLVWTIIAFTELTLLATTVWFGVCAYERWGPGRMRGMATASEAEKIMGLARLRKVAGIVRPDLYGKHTPAPEPLHRSAAGDTTRHDLELGPMPRRGLIPWLLDRRLSQSTGE